MLNSIDSVRTLADLMLLFLQSLPTNDRARLERRIGSEPGFDAAMATTLPAVHDAAASCLASDPEAFDTGAGGLSGLVSGGDDDMRRMATFGLSEYAAAMFEAARVDAATLARARRRASELIGLLARH